MDISITESGELELDTNGDLKIVEGNEEIAQSVMFRCKTVAGDFSLQPNCGASLESLIGEVNNAETGVMLQLLIEDALTHDGFINEDDLNVEVFPVSQTAIMAIINITHNNEPVQIAVNLDLREGKVTQTRL